MPTLDDPAIEDLIAYLAFPISPTARRTAFCDAARAALEQVACLDLGIAHRIVGGLQHQFFDPPDDRRASWGIEQELRGNSKLCRAAPIKDGRDLRFTRRLKLVW